jgi:hypothetical protein
VSPGEAAALPDRTTDTSAEQRAGNPDYGALLRSPEYDGIVGGEEPSPFVSAFLLAGLGCLLGAAIGSTMGMSATQLWTLGAMFVVIATFLAGFVSRSA